MDWADGIEVASRAQEPTENFHLILQFLLIFMDSFSVFQLIILIFCPQHCLIQQALRTELYLHSDAHN